VNAPAEPAFVGIEITRGRLQSIVDEAGAALIRSAFSHIVREAKDFACAIMSPDGETVVQSSQSIPVFLGTMTHTVRNLLRHFPAARFAPGEVVGTNDPWLCTGHLFDLTLMAPVFVGGELVAFAAITAHLPDIGGRGFTVDSTTVFEEGLRLPPLRFASDERLEPVVRDIIAANVRLPEQVLGDIGAMLNGLAVVGARLSRLCEEITPAAFRDVRVELDRRTEAYVRQAIAALPDGVYRAELDSEGVVGKGFSIRLRVEVEGDAIALDFAGSTPQIGAAINSCISYTRAYVIFALKCLLAPQLPFNEGVVRPFRIDAPEGSVVNSAFPAAGAARNLVGHYIPMLVMNAIRDLVPASAIAECGSPRPIISLTGTDPREGRMYYAPVLVMGGFGARATKDGPSALVFPTNTQVVPVEMIESTTPLRIEEKELIPDSGGPGEFRGGLGQRVTVRCIAGEATVSLIAQHLKHGPAGASGGEPGRRTRPLLAGRELDQIPGPVTLAAGDAVTLESPGGGGMGPPAKRDPARLRRDQALGYVTDASAYGAGR
jgi:N-methylhydantoinase B